MTLARKSLPHTAWRAWLAWGAAFLALPGHAALPVEQLVPRITAQVVQVVAAGPQGAQFGSAVLLEDGLAVTACHVVGDGRELLLGLGVGLKPASLVAANRRHDLCLLRGPAGLASGLRAQGRTSGSLQVGETHYAVGFASGRLGFSRGPLQARHALEGGQVLRTGAGFLSGASGGGLFDTEGQVVGVLVALHRGAGGPIHLAAPWEWVEALRAQASASPPPPPSEALPPFWDLEARDAQGQPTAPLFLQALQLEASQRWEDLLGVATAWVAASPDDPEAQATLMRARAATRPADRPGAAIPVSLVEVEDARCTHHDARLVILRRHADAPPLTVWLARWYLDRATADRGRHALNPSRPEVELGCSRTHEGGEQRWELLSWTADPAPRR